MTTLIHWNKQGHAFWTCHVTISNNFICLKVKELQQYRCLMRQNRHCRHTLSWMPWLQLPTTISLWEILTRSAQLFFYMVALVISCAHKRNFVVKCEVDSLVWNQYIAKPKEKNVGDMVYYIPTVWKRRGTRLPCPSPNCAHGCAQFSYTL